MFKHQSVNDLMINGNKRWRFKFPNEYGASVIIGPHTYGGTEGLYELAVLDPDWNLCYSTPITDDVIGHLTVQQVNDLCDRIAALPVCVPEKNQVLGGRFA
jgi:hypothetical protein